MQHLLRREETLDTTQLGDLAEQPQRAARLVLAAAANGEIEAQALLGQILLEGYGIQADPTLALTGSTSPPSADMPWPATWPGAATNTAGVAQPIRSAPPTTTAARPIWELDWGMYNLANLLATGRGVVKDHDRLPALSSGCRAWSCQVDEPHRPLPRRRLRRGPDVTAAHARYARSAEAGDFRGQFSHAAVLLAQGQWEQARGWLERALRLGHLRFIETALASLRAAALPQIADIVEAYARRHDELRAGAR